MTVEEKAVELSKKYGSVRHKNKEIATYQASLEMAVWKDNQFEELLKQKEDVLTRYISYCDPMDEMSRAAASLRKDTIQTLRDELFNNNVK